MAKNFDVIVVGGGPAGLMAAKTAAEHNLKTALIEKRKDIAKWTRADCMQFYGLEGNFLGEDIKVDVGKVTFPRNGFEIKYTGGLYPIYHWRCISPHGHRVDFKSDYPIAAVFDKGILLRDLFAEIEKLKKEKNAIILAHYYQEPDIQDVADYIGDSLGLSQKAENTNADIIVFAGVHFMAETAKILNPGKKVILPDLKAGCSLADSCPPTEFKKFKEQYPDHLVISYINCSAEIKALSDVICTSSNAVKIVESFPEDQKIDS